jgi:hypothetical protein
MTNIANIHTCTISGENLVLPFVLISGGQLVQLPCNVICCSSVGVLVCINFITIGSCCSALGIVVVECV